MARRAESNCVQEMRSSDTVSPASQGAARCVPGVVNSVRTHADHQGTVTQAILLIHWVLF